mmetsp:Transcript_2940/g.10404  ORF Transcript_2940/g.10404 Transcript_2940/m.10404 type:complete len:209 (+) Transcript_2940:1051-1677(+)
MSHLTRLSSCFSLAMLVALTIFRSSSMSMNPEPSRSNTWNANFTLFSRASVPTLLSPTMNSFRSISPPRSVSNIEKRRSTNGLRSTRKMRQNSLMSTMPVLSLSISRNFLYSFLSWSLCRPCMRWKDSMSCTGLPVGAGAGPPPPAGTIAPPTGGPPIIIPPGCCPGGPIIIPAAPAPAIMPALGPTPGAAAGMGMPAKDWMSFTNSS